MDLDALRHSCAHLLASAVKETYPNAKMAIGPAIEDGFYYDFDNLSITDKDLVKIETKMHEIANKKLNFEKILMKRKEAEKFLKDQPYKLELLNDIPGEKVQFYKHGDYYDMCKGGHLKNTSEIKAFKLTKIAQAYWRGDSKNK
ncbi:MAG: threonine--tRNA ligase, partial [Nanoarchaeota archaeon]